MSVTIKDGAGADKVLTTSVVSTEHIPHQILVNQAGEALTGDYILDMQQGNIVGHAIMSAMGEWEGGTVDANGEDCMRFDDVSGPSILPTPASAGEQMTIISSSTSDDSAGTGVRTIRLHYLDSTGAEQTEDITMNGTTGVNTTATDIRFVNDVYTLTVGSGGVAAGHISVYKQGGSIGNDLYQLIALGGNKSLVPHRMVPLAKTLYLKGWHTEISTSDRCAMKIRSTDMNGTLLSGVFCFKDVAYISNNATGFLSLPSIPIPALSIIKVSHWDNVLGSEGSCGWWGVLIDD